MINSVILSGTIVGVEERGSARKVTIEGFAYSRKTKQEEPTRVMFTCFGDRTGIVVGSVVVVRGEVEMREWQGKFFTDIIGREFETLGTAPARSAPPAQRQAPAPSPPAPAPRREQTMMDYDSDIPF